MLVTGTIVIHGDLRRKKKLFEVQQWYDSVSFTYNLGDKDVPFSDLHIRLGYFYTDLYSCWDENEYGYMYNFKYTMTHAYDYSDGVNYKDIDITKEEFDLGVGLLTMTIPLNKVPLYVNDRLFKNIAMYRLKNGI